MAFLAKLLNRPKNSAHLCFNAAFQTIFPYRPFEVLIISLSAAIC
jgi:hypothetical protein